MKIKPTNISKEEKTRIFKESLKNQTPYTEKEPVKIQPVSQWISVEEKVPDISGNYLCYLATDEFEVLYFDRGIEDDEYNLDYPFGVWNTYTSDEGGECREWIEVLEVTHWQPLPKKPQD